MASPMWKEQVRRRTWKSVCLESRAATQDGPQGVGRARPGGPCWALILGGMGVVGGNREERGLDFPLEEFAPAVDE